MSDIVLSVGKTTVYAVITYLGSSDYIYSPSCWSNYDLANVRPNEANIIWQQLLLLRSSDDCVTCFLLFFSGEAAKSSRAMWYWIKQYPYTVMKTIKFQIRFLSLHFLTWQKFPLVSLASYEDVTWKTKTGSRLYVSNDNISLSKSWQIRYCFFFIHIIHRPN